MGKWGCDAKTSSGSVSSMCQKSCKKCTPTAPPTTINEPKTQTKASSTGGTTQPANEKTTKTSAENNQKAKEIKTKQTAVASEKREKQAVVEKTKGNAGGCVTPPPKGASCES